MQVFEVIKSLRLLSKEVYNWVFPDVLLWKLFLKGNKSRGAALMGLYELLKHNKSRGAALMGLYELLKHNKSRGAALMGVYELLKHNHLQLQLRISRQWFTKKNLLNTRYLNFMGRVTL